MDTKALRQKILDLAIRGKLVPQDPNDEPASVLLERIRAEKQQMVKDGKLKAKDIKNDTVIFKGEDNLHYEKFADGTVKCIEDEIPFDVPEGWSFCRLNNLFNVCSSKRVLQADWKSEGVPFYRAREIVKLSNDGCVNNDLFISQEHYDKLKGKYGVPNIGDLMVTGVGTIGKVYIVEEDKQFYYKDASVLCFENFSKLVCSKYAKLLIDSTLLQNQIHSQTYGNTVDTITITIANGYLCVLPPLAEQQRIVDCIENHNAIIESLETDINIVKDRISVAKSKILDLAIRGKLVPQDPNDEPASVLLERIRAEKEELIKQGKIKRDKKESVIFKGEDNSYYEKIGDIVTCIDGELPFDIPDNWTWSRLNSICSILTDGTHKTPKYSEKGYTFLSSKNVTSGVIDWNNVMYIPEELHSELYSRLAPKTNDILLAKNGTTGSSAIVDRDCVFDIYVSLALIRLIENKSMPNYVQIAIQSPYIQSYFNKSLKGIGVPNLHLEHIRKTLVPIPPLSEQIEINDAFKLINSSIKNIEASLN